MRTLVLLAVVALFCGAALAVRGDGGVKLHKPVIVNPLETPTVAASLKGISEILGSEPAAAADPASEGSDADEAEGMDDIALMGEDDCDTPLPSEKCAAKKAGASGAAPHKHAAGSESGAAESTESTSSEGSEASSSESSAAPARGDKTEAEIHTLEKLIAQAMKISKAIPEKVKRLEQLKHKEEEMTEERARAEAEGTLKEHARLLEEMKTHIGKLEHKLKELKQKRDELVQSDARLRATLSGAAPSSSEESSEESSESTKAF